MDDIDRDLIYGQIVLKVLLADARRNHITEKAAYFRAFKMYSGEADGRASGYARSSVHTMNTI